MKLAGLFTFGSFLCYFGALAVPVADFDAKVASGLRLIQTSDEKPPFWVTEEGKLDLLKDDVTFFDLTETYHLEESMKATKINAIVERATYPAPSRQTAVNALLPSLSTANMNSYLSRLAAFHNRYYTTNTGLQASNYIYDTLSGFARGKSGVTVTKFSHSWSQQSIIARIAGSSATAPLVILGAHEDSINSGNPTSGRAPGADDDGTGAVNLMEIFRVLVANNFKPTRNIEFHFYSAEEVGLLGSQAISANYRSSGKSVYAMLNLDMTGYFRPGTTEVITLITDNTDSGLNTFVRSLVSSYSHLPVGTSSCGYACSDHATWNRQGFPSAFLFEAAMSNSNPYIHSASDTTSVNGFSWAHSLEFAKIGLAFAYELGA